MEWISRHGRPLTSAGQCRLVRRLSVGWRIFFLCVGVLGLLVSGSLRAALIPEYVVGDQARFTVTASAPMSVLDPTRTQELQEQKAALVPPVYRFHSGLAEEAESVLRESFDRMRDTYVKSLNQAARRPKLDPETLEHPSFLAFNEWFRQRHPAFPLTTELAREWAMQESDADTFEAWSGRLRAAMSQCVRDDFVPASMAIGAVGARMVPVNAADEVLSNAIVQKRGIEMSLAEVLTLQEAREKLRQEDVIIGDSSAVGEYLGGFLRVNCFPEEELTQQVRRHETEGLTVVDYYASGEVVVAAGAQIDSRAKAALDVMRADQEAILEEHDRRQASSQFRTGLLSRLPRWFGNPLEVEARARQGLWWLGGISLVATGFLAFLVKRKRSRALAQLPCTPDDAAFTVMLNPQRQASLYVSDREETTDTETSDAMHFLQDKGELGGGDSAHIMKLRGLEAERRAEEIMAMVRAGLAPQLAKRMMNRLVQELITQRGQWIHTQQVAERDLSELEQRIAQSNAQMQERLKAFEKRTEELEKALALKAEETAELLKSHIALTQKQLQAKDGAQELIWN